MTARARCSVRADRDAERALAEVDGGHVVGDELGAEALGLLAEAQHQSGPSTPSGKPG